ncbi:MAG: glycosyltransferase family 2 protein [Lysobacteraceae bacterium]
MTHAALTRIDECREDEASAPPSATTISVVIPAHNEAGNIAALLQEVCDVLRERIAFEIVCVDDGSSDDTAQVLRWLAGRMPELRPFQHEACRGQSVALLSGVRSARYPWIVTLDGDGQNDPADIPSLLAHLEASAPEVKLIAGWRVTRNDGSGKRIASRLANRVRRVFLHDGTPDTGCGIKLFERTAFLSLPAFNHMHRYLPALMQRAGWRTISVAVNHRPRESGRSKYTNLGRALVGIRDLLGVAWLVARHVRTNSRPVWEERP